MRRHRLSVVIFNEQRAQLMLNGVPRGRTSRHYGCQKKLCKFFIFFSNIGNENGSSFEVLHQSCIGNVVSPEKVHLKRCEHSQEIQRGTDATSRDDILCQCCTPAPTRAIAPIARSCGVIVNTEGWQHHRLPESSMLTHVFLILWQNEAQFARHFIREVILWQPFCSFREKH